MQRIMTLNDLKAKAYDTLAQIEFMQRQLQELNHQIAQKSVEPEYSDESEIQADEQY